MYEENQQRHIMQLETTHESGAEEWFCPTCGRRFLMQWPPDYKKVVLEPGDESAIHTGGKGGLRMGAFEVNSDPEKPEDELRTLEPFQEWMDRINFELLWK